MKSLLLKSLNGMHGIASHLPSFGKFQPPRGTFSAYDELQRGKLEGGILHERQPVGSCPRSSMTELCHFHQHDQQPWPIFWCLGQDARLVGRLGLWRNSSDEVCSEAVYKHPDFISLGEDKWCSQLIVPEPLFLEGAWTSLCSKWNRGENYYHWLTDGLTRLLVRDSLPEDTKILIPAHPSKFVRETIELLGLSDRAVEMETACLQPERYYFCSPMAMTGVRNPLGFAWLRKAFSSCYGNRNSGSPIFLSRRSGARVPGNLAELENHIQSIGFEIIDCGEIKVAEQISKVSSAPAVIGLHGAAMTNILWARPGTPVLEIFEPGYLNGCYEQIAYDGDLPHTYFFRDSKTDIQRIDSWFNAFVR